MITYTGIKYWFQTLITISFPFLAIFMTGYMRVAVVYFRWKKWQIIVYKIMLITCGMIFFFIGVRFMSGNYRITGGKLAEF